MERTRPLAFATVAFTWHPSANGQPNAMKMILTSDLHQMIGKWDDLVNLVRVERPRFVLIAGDLLPKDGGHKAQKEFFPKLKRHRKRMNEVASLNVYLYLGTTTTTSWSRSWTAWNAN